jgi:hypothetical protein
MIRIILVSVLLVAPLLFSPISLRIPENVILRNDITASDIAIVFACTKDYEIATVLDMLHVKIYSTGDDAEIVYQNLKGMYQWEVVVDEVYFESDECRIRLLAFRHMASVHAFVIAEGGFIFYETGYNTLLMTSYGTIFQYQILLDAL